MDYNINMDQIRKNIELKGPEDRKRINIFESNEVKYWATKLGVTQEDIETAVYQIGDKVEDVKTYLNKK